MSRPFPTRMALTTFRAKKVAAQRGEGVAMPSAYRPNLRQSQSCTGLSVFCSTGYDLLKKKSDALTFRFREITRKIKDAKEAMGEQMRATIFSVSEAVWAAGDFKCVSAPGLAMVCGGDVVFVRIRLGCAGRR
jgi:vacuolar-type H+-ATPase subunit D/Vma8